MAGGEPFRDRQRRAIDRARADVLARHGLAVAVYVGDLVGASPRAAARGLLAALGSASLDTVLVAVDPAARGCEIVTGAAARRRIDDRSCALVALALTSSFAAGDLAGGLVHGIRMLGEYAGPPRRGRPAS